MKQLPSDVKAYKRTPTFTQDTIPNGLRKDHNTKAGVWAKINILKGELEYHITEGELEKVILNENTPGIVEPEIKHFIKPVNEVEVFIEFYKLSKESTGK